MFEKVSLYREVETFASGGTQGPKETGWVCPKCGRVWGPMWMACTACKEKTNA